MLYAARAAMPSAAMHASGRCCLQVHGFHSAVWMTGWLGWMAAPRSGMSNTKRRRLDAASTVFTFLFTAECCVKLLGFGFAGFCSDGMNLFDAAVVVLSLVDTFASVSLPCPSAAAAVALPCPADMSAGYAAVLDVASNTLTCLFATEVVLKLLGLGTWGFLSDPFNAFDLIVVVLGVLEMALSVGVLARDMHSTINAVATTCQSFAPCMASLEQGTSLSLSPNFLNSSTHPCADGSQR